MMRRVTVTGTGVCVAGLLACLAFAGSAAAAVPWWHLDSLSMPATLAPGSSGSVYVTASNLGAGEVSGSTETVTLRDVLPAGVLATSALGSVGGVAGIVPGLRGTLECKVVTVSLVECSYAGGLPPYEQLEVIIGVEVQAGAKPGANEVSVAGGGAPAVSLTRPLLVGPGATGFGVASYEAAAYNEDGSLDSQAGSHPFAFTTSLDLNRTASKPFVPGLAKDLRFSLPPGFVGNPTAFPQCSDAQFQREIPGRVNECPPDSAIGVAQVAVYEPQFLTFPGRSFFTFAVPVFNLKPAEGEPARFGFEVIAAHVTLDTAVRTGGDYGVTVSSTNITQLTSFLGAQVTFWGAPGDPVHDQSRGWECVAGGTWVLIAESISPCSPSGHAGAPPFLTLPTSCTGPLQSSVESDQWAAPASREVTGTMQPMQALDGCNRLPFSSEIKVAPDGQAASTPTGLHVDVHVPQEAGLNASGLADSAVRDITVALPEGVALNPAAGDGLGSCTAAQAGFLGFRELDPVSEPGVNSAAFTPDQVSCPDSAKIGTVSIHTPLLPNPLTGFVYLASPQNLASAPPENPFSSLLALYLVARDPVSGVLVKLPGRVTLNEETGQASATFNDTPQQPFEDAEISFFGGARAPMSTPARCAAYTTNATATPWSGGEPSASSSHFDITTGPNGSPCPPQTLPFAPSLAGGSANINAGSFTPLSTTIARDDGQQAIHTITLHYPPGVSGMLSAVKLCGEPQASEGTCGADSLIGEDTVSAGLGPDPLTVAGARIYITGPYQGAPFGLSIVNPTKAGPFDLSANTPCDCVVDRAKIEIDPHTAALTVTTDTTGAYVIPHILDGIPLQLKHINVTINRPGFTFNPTNCNPMAITGSIGGDEGTISPVSIPFQVTNCAALKFAPKFQVSTSGKSSKAKGASLTVKLSYPAGSQGTEANIARVKVELPKQLPSQLKTLQKACLASVFEANPAGCPAESIVGHATVHTPLLPVPLTGPAYFVSHGGEAFPDLTLVLQGYGVTVDLVGTTFISKAGITSSTFKAAPDVPFNTFELTLPQGTYAALTTYNHGAAGGSLCGQTLAMPTEFRAQNGAEIHQSTPITVTGCPAAITVVRQGVKGKTATIQVRVPGAGKLVATAKGLSKASKTAKGATTLTLKLTLTNAEAAFLGKHKTRKLKAKVNLQFTPKKGGKLKTSTTVILG